MLSVVDYFEYSDKNSEKVYTIIEAGKTYLNKRQDVFLSFTNRLHECKGSRLFADGSRHHCGMRA